MIDESNFFDQPVRHGLIKYDNIRLKQVKKMIIQLVICQTIIIFQKKNYYKMTEIDFSKQQAHDAEPKAI